MFETRGNRKQLNVTSSMDPGMEDSCRIFKIQRGRERKGEGGGGREKRREFLYVWKKGLGVNGWD